MNIKFKENFFWWLMVALFLIAISMWSAVFAAGGNLLKVYFLDIGQGDAAFVELPNKYQILIDGGPGREVINQLAAIMPFYDRSIDLIVATHPQADHISGLVEVLKRYQVGEVMMSNAEGKIEDFVELKKLSAGKVVTPVAGRVYDLQGGASLKVLWPKAGLDFGGLADVNEASIVLQLGYGSQDFLFTGDLGTITEPEVSWSDIEVLKVAHHGSRYATSREFLGKTRPEIAVISVAKNNSYGHPTPETLGGLKDVGAEVWQTAISGTVAIFSDGERSWVKK